MFVFFCHETNVFYSINQFTPLYEPLLSVIKQQTAGHISARWPGGGRAPTPGGGIGAQAWPIHRFYTRSCNFAGCHASPRLAILQGPTDLLACGPGCLPRLPISDQEAAMAQGAHPGLFKELWTSGAWRLFPLLLVYMSGAFYLLLAFYGVVGHIKRRAAASSPTLPVLTCPFRPPAPALVCRRHNAHPSRPRHHD